MKTIEIAGSTYQIGKLPAINQLHVARRLGPVLAIMGITAAHLSGEQEIDLRGFVPLLGPMSQVLSQMTDDDANYVIAESLSVVKVEVQGRPAPVIAVNGDHFPRLMREDMDLPTMLRLTWESIRENLGGFMQGLSDVAPSTSP